MFRSPSNLRATSTLVCLLAVTAFCSTRLSGSSGDTVPDRELGQIDFAHNSPGFLDGGKLSGPHDVAVDTRAVPNRLYVEDSANNRVLAWFDAAGFGNGSPADFVIGEADLFSNTNTCASPNATSLCNPRGITVDHSGNLYIADSGNNRVLEYFAPVKSNATAAVVFGQLGSFTSNTANKGGITPDSLWAPDGLAVDGASNLYIADSKNNRVLYFDRTISSFTSPTLVFGQRGTFFTNACNNGGLDAGSLCQPESVAVDKTGNVYIADASNNRALEYDIPPNAGNTVAHRVLGQAGQLNSAVCNLGGISADSLCHPQGVIIDGAGRLYIADTDRVLGYANPLSSATADLVLGQGGSFTAGTCNQGGISADSLCAESGLAVDSDNSLYVADEGNNRVLAYTAPVSSAAAARELGQRNFNNNQPNYLDARGLNTPQGVAVDRSVSPNHLYVSDSQDNRVLRWNDASGFYNGQPADIVLGQPDFFSSLCNNGGVSATSLCNPGSLAVDPSGNLYVADIRNNRVLEYDAPVKSGAAAHLVFGQNGSFTSTTSCSLTDDRAPSLIVSADTLCLNMLGFFDNRTISGVAVDPSGNIYISDTIAARLLEYDTPLVHGTTATRAIAGPLSGLAGFCFPAAGGPIRCAGGAGPLCCPAGLAVDSSGNLFVGDPGARINGKVFEYNAANTAPDRTYGLFSHSQIGIAVDGSDNLYVADGQVLQFTDPLIFGNPSLVFGGGGSGVAVDAAANLYVADTNNNRVLEYDAPPTPKLPTGTITRTTINFGNEVVGVPSSPHSTTFKSNVFADPTVMTTGDFSETIRCALKPCLIPSTYAIDVVFTPTRLGLRTGTLTIAGTPQMVTMVGTGVTRVSLTPDVLAFAPQTVGTKSPAKSVIVRNNDTTTHLLKSIGLSGANPADFSQTNNCGATLAGRGGFCVVSVVFAPKTVGSKQATLVVSYDADESPQVASLTGTVTSPTPAPTPSRTPLRTPTKTPVRTPKPTPTVTPVPGHPFIKSIPKIVLVGGTFNITGLNFTNGSVVNFFIATSKGTVNPGPFTPIAKTLPTMLTVKVPPTVKLGEGFVNVQVVNTDQSFVASNSVAALLQGDPAAGIPSITSINAKPLADTSHDPNFATNNVETVAPQGTIVKLGGMGFDTAHGVAVDLFCACPGGKVGPFFLNPGNPGLTSSLISFPVPAAGPNAPVTGPGSFVVSNAGPLKNYALKSNAVSVPIGEEISVASVKQGVGTITVNGTGFSTLTVINFFNTEGSKSVNFGGLKPNGMRKILLTFVNSHQFKFSIPVGTVPGASYVQTFNPPFVPFTSSDNTTNGAFTLK